ATYLGFALPGIVVALALVFFAIRYTPSLYQTLWMLVAAYTIRFLPEALASVRASLMQIRPSLEDAAHGLGRRTPAVFATITVPLARPGIAAGAALGFLTAMKELPATILLAPTGFDTLATSIWSATSEGFFARAAAPALLLVAVAAIPTAILAIREAQFSHE
ncbi:MAG: ABC transporter permease subunit, partial [Dehalococcoidia bacterium]